MQTQGMAIFPFLSVLYNGPFLARVRFQAKRFLRRVLGCAFNRKIMTLERYDLDEVQYVQEPFEDQFIAIESTVVQYCDVLEREMKTRLGDGRVKVIFYNITGLFPRSAPCSIVA